MIKAQLKVIGQQDERPMAGPGDIYGTQVFFKQVNWPKALNFRRKWYKYVKICIFYPVWVLMRTTKRVYPNKKLNFVLILIIFSSN